MDFFSALTGISSAFGLSASAGLNAYIPLLMVALVARFTDLINLSEPYDTLTSLPVIGVLAVLLVIEMFVDKIPALDTINDIIQTLARPTAGALMFASQSNVISDMSPVLAVIAGLFLSGGVHATKTVTRPVITAATAGTGNWVVSILEDVIAFFVSLFAIVIPFVAMILFVVIGFFFIRWYLRKKRDKKYKWKY